MSILYETVARLCREQGLSVSALCRRAGVSPGILSDLKTGRKKTISVETAGKLAEALGVSADVLRGAEQSDNDAFLAYYGRVKDYLNEDDRSDLIAFMRVRAELKKNDKSGNGGAGTR